MNEHVRYRIERYEYDKKMYVQKPDLDTTESFILFRYYNNSILFYTNIAVGLRSFSLSGFLSQPIFAGTSYRRPGP